MSTTTLAPVAVMSSLPSGGASGTSGAAGSAGGSGDEFARLLDQAGPKRSADSTGSETTAPPATTGASQRDAMKERGDAEASAIKEATSAARAAGETKDAAHSGPTRSSRAPLPGRTSAKPQPGLGAAGDAAADTAIATRAGSLCGTLESLQSEQLGDTAEALLPDAAALLPTVALDSTRSAPAWDASTLQAAWTAQAPAAAAAAALAANTGPVQAADAAMAAAGVQATGTADASAGALARKPVGHEQAAPGHALLRATAAPANAGAPHDAAPAGVADLGHDVLPAALSAKRLAATPGADAQPANTAVKNALDAPPADLTAHDGAVAAAAGNGARREGPADARSGARVDATASSAGPTAAAAKAAAGETPGAARAAASGREPGSKADGESRPATAPADTRAAAANALPDVPGTLALARAASELVASKPGSNESSAASAVNGATAGSFTSTPGALAWVAPAAGGSNAVPTSVDGRITASPGAPEFAPQLAAHITTFVRDGVQHAKLELNPAEMGPLTVQIQLDGNAARVHLAAENAQTRQALEQAMPQLAGSLREGGLTLSGGGVFEQPRQPQQQAQNGSGNGNADSRNADASNRASSAPGSDTRASSVAAPPARRRSGVVDLVA